MIDFTGKLVREGSEKRRLWMRLLSICLGFELFFFGIACIIIQTLLCAGEAFHKGFFLLLSGAALVLCGIIAFAVTGVERTVAALCDQSRQMKARSLRLVVASAVSLLFFVGIAVSMTPAAPYEKAGAVFLISSLAAGMISIILRKGETRNEKER